jgi:hypothetical protein
MMIDGDIAADQPRECGRDLEFAGIRKLFPFNTLRFEAETAP